MIIHLTRISPSARRFSRRGATIPEDQTDWLPFLCFVLHRMGFFLPRALLRERRALTSPFHPCLRFSQRTGGMFSVTLSVVAIIQLRRPRISRGMLPYGVRTFLQRT